MSGAITLGALVWLQHKQNAQPQTSTSTLPGDGWSALASFVYAAGFSFAYLSMTAATGALLLFGAVQATMIAWGLYQGERMRTLQLGGFALAVAGLTALMLPGLATPGFGGSAAMLGAGVALGRLFAARQAQTNPQQRQQPHGGDGGQLCTHRPHGAGAQCGGAAAVAPEQQRRAVRSGLWRADIECGLRRVVPRATHTAGHARGHGAAQRAVHRGIGWHRVVGLSRHVAHGAVGLRHHGRHWAGDLEQSLMAAVP